MLDKRSITLSIALATVACVTSANEPNVIVIMTDDQGNNVGFQGNPHVTTPHIDRLAEQSVRLTNFHQMPMCTASRAGLMSGQYAEQTGAWRTSLGRTMMRGDTYTIAEAFKAGGYATGQFGKWHLGDNWPMRPQDQGFDEVVGLRCGAVGQIADYWGNDYFDDTYYHNGEPRQYEGYCTDVFFGETIRFIKEKKDEPFFIYLAPNITHLPLRVAEEYSRPHVDKGVNEKLAVLYGMIDNLDENIGRLMACLKETGLDENTIIFMTTDDGVQGAAVSQTPNYWNMGMRGKKGSQEEGGHRVFSFLRWPAGRIGAGTDNNTLISVHDVYPTLLDLCGLDEPKDVEFSGRSFKPYLKNPLDPEDDDRTIFFYYFSPKKLDQRENQNCVIWKNWRLLADQYLYDISKDRMQEHDLAAEYPEVVEELNARFDAYHARGKMLVQEPVRFILGDPRAPKVELTSQDAYWTEGVSSSQAFGQSDAFNLKQAHGPYKVSIARPGKYTFKLSRYPLYTELPLGRGGRKMERDFEIEKVRMSIAGQTVEEAVTPEDIHASFTLELEAGDADLETALIGNGKDGVAYFVTVEFEVMGRQEHKPYDNHFWQMSAFGYLHTAMALAHELPETHVYLEYIYGLLMAKHPILGPPDGGWANGHGYFHVNDVTILGCAEDLLVGGVDLFDTHPWYSSTVKYLMYCTPVGSQVPGFGDKSETHPNQLNGFVLQFLFKQAKDDPLAQWQLRRQRGAKAWKTDFSDWDYILAGSVLEDWLEAPEPKAFANAAVFRGVGLAALHSDLNGNPDEDIVVYLRSSPYGGGIAHMTCSQNAFNISYKGEKLFYHTGHYKAGFASDHIFTDYRHTRSHNGLLVNGLSQGFGTQYYGWIMHFGNVDQIAYACGDASMAYGGVDDKAREHRTGKFGLG